MTLASRILVVSAVAGMLAACASGTSWKKPGSSPSEARAALSECRSRANVDIEDRYGSDLNRGGGGIGDEFRTSVTRNEAARGLDRAIAECMTEKGYLRR
jgi:hypothetical protein